VNRREFLWSGSAFLAAPSLGGEAASRGEAAPSAAIRDYESASGGRVGVHAEHVRSGVKLAWRAHERFVMCSTFKASLAACVLSRVDAGQEHLDSLVSYRASDMQDYAPVAQANLAKGVLSVGAMCKAAVELSDNTCANLLLSRIGGPGALTRFWRTLGDRTTRLDEPEPYLNRTPPGGVRNTTTPASMAFILRRLVLESALSETSRSTLTEWLIGCQTGGNRLRAGLPKEWRVGDKTGNNGNDAAGDIAVVWPNPDSPIIVCVYTRYGSPTSGQLESVFAAIGRTLGTRFSS